MDSPQAGLTLLGERIQEALEAETQAAEQVRVVRTRLLEHVAERGQGSARRNARRRWLYAGLAAAATLALVAVVAESWWAPISFMAGSREGNVGDVLAADEHDSLRVEFSEGSFMLLHESASARVLETRAAGARVLLESGVAEVSIAHRRGHATRWSFEAGPFQVLVKGTQFELGWQPAQQALSLTMKTGSVEVSGACLHEPQLVTRGASLRLSCAKPAPPARDTASPAVKPLKREPKAEPSFETSCEAASKGELVAWASRERLAGSVARARTALLALRRRFSGSKEAGTAAFTLGRMAYDQRANYAEAARWFTAYLAEQPDGPLMGDARGRLLEAHEQLGNRAAARRDAEGYLRRFPDGPYANQARRILAR